MKKERILSLIIFITILFYPLTAYADMGPKPSIHVTFEGLNNRTVYASFFALEGGPSPVSYGDIGTVPEEITQKFLDYSENETARFVEDIWIINEEKKTMKCGYMPPRKYKLVVYIPDENVMLESDFYTRKIFEEKYTTDLSTVSGKLTLVHVAYDWKSNILSVLKRIVLTVAIELAIAFLFKIKGTKSILVIVITNVITQLFLNICLLRKEYMSGGGMYYMFIYFIIEIAIFITEAIVYANALKKTNNPPVGIAKAVAYSFVANFITFMAGIFF